MYLCYHQYVKHMLKKFCVTNFKSFENELYFDLSSANGYTFNPECVEHGIIKNCIIYGHNGCGKSNLGLAILDIISHLTDNHKDLDRYRNYINAYHPEALVKFVYDFKIEESNVHYEYHKSSYTTLVFESLSIDGKEVIHFDRSNGNNVFTCTLQGTETLNTEITDNTLSALKYIKNNSTLPETTENKSFVGFYTFVEQMLFFRTLEDRTYLGRENSSKHTLTSEIIRQGKVAEFQALLKEAHISGELCVVNNINGEEDLAFDYNGKKLLFTSVMSTGTSALMLFFYWYLCIERREVSLIFIDEFDAFYHHELAKLIVRKLKETGVQFILTTHNTSLLSNDLMRPDCYYLMGNNKIQALSRSTEKELREVHNIEKIYKAGGFYVE